MYVTKLYKVFHAYISVVMYQAGQQLSSSSG